jgi:hypothetical protein
MTNRPRVLVWLLGITLALAGPNLWLGETIGAGKRPPKIPDQNHPDKPHPAAPKHEPQYTAAHRPKPVQPVKNPAKEGKAPHSDYYKHGQWVRQDHKDLRDYHYNHHYYYNHGYYKEFFKDYVKEYGTTVSIGKDSVTYYEGFAHYHWAHFYFAEDFGTYLYYDPQVTGDQKYYYWCEKTSCYYPITYVPYGYSSTADKVKDEGQASDPLRAMTVWEDGTDKVLTIIERQGEKFRARFVIGTNVVREVNGTVKDGKVLWLAKDVQPIKGGAGVDNEGTINKDAKGFYLDFSWRHPGGKSGTFTLRQKAGN